MEMELHGSLREQIVATLTRTGPCEAATMRTVISGSGRTYSIQAIYKELHELQARGVVLRSKGKFNLSLPWAIELSKYAANLVRKLSQSSGPSELLPEVGKTRRSFHFSNLAQADDFWVHAVFVLLENSTDPLLYNWLPHPWFHLVNGHKSSMIHRALKERGYVVKSIVGGDSPLDRRSKKLSLKGTYDFTFSGGDFCQERTSYYSVSDRYVLALRLKPEFARSLDAIYALSETKGKMEIAPIVEITSRSTKITVSIESDARKVQQLRRRFQRYLNR